MSERAESIKLFRNKSAGTFFSESARKKSSAQRFHFLQSLATRADPCGPIKDRLDVRFKRMTRSEKIIIDTCGTRRRQIPSGSSFSQFKQWWRCRLSPNCTFVHSKTDLQRQTERQTYGHGTGEYVWWPSGESFQLEYVLVSKSISGYKTASHVACELDTIF